MSLRIIDEEADSSYPQMSKNPHGIRKKYSARRFAASAAFCPVCSRRLDDNETFQCESCGFTGEQTMKLFPYQAPVLDTLCDNGNRFSEKEQKALTNSLKQFSRWFPQIQVKMFTLKPDITINLKLFGFWLFNASPLAENETTTDRTWTILIILGPENNIAAVPGYAVEPWIPYDDWLDLMDDYHDRSTEHGNFTASTKFLSSCRLVLKKRWSTVQAQLKKSRGRDTE